MFQLNQELYIAIKGLIRVNKDFESRGYKPTLETSAFVKRVIVEINSLGFDESNLVYFYSQISDYVEENADQLDEIEYSYYIAIGDFAYYFTELNQNTLEEVIEDVLDYYRALAQKDLFEENNYDSLILEANEIHKIEQNVLIVNEKKQQEKDKLMFRENSNIFPIE